MSIENDQSQIGNPGDSINPWTVLGLGVPGASEPTPESTPFIVPGFSEMAGPSGIPFAEATSEPAEQPLVSLEEDSVVGAEDTLMKTSPINDDASVAAEDVQDNSFKDKVDSDNSHTPAVIIKPVLLDPEAGTHQDLVWAQEQLNRDMNQFGGTVQSLFAEMAVQMTIAQTRYDGVANNLRILANKRDACLGRMEGTEEEPGTKKRAEDALAAFVEADTQFGEASDKYNAPLNEIIGAAMALRDSTPEIKSVDLLAGQYDEVVIAAFAHATGYVFTKNDLEDFRSRSAATGAVATEDGSTFKSLAKSRADRFDTRRTRDAESEAAAQEHQNEVDTLAAIRLEEKEASQESTAASNDVRRQERMARAALRASQGGTLRIALRKAGVYLGLTAGEPQQTTNVMEIER